MATSARAADDHIAASGGSAAGRARARAFCRSPMAPTARFCTSATRAFSRASSACAAHRHSAPSKATRRASQLQVPQVPSPQSWNFLLQPTATDLAAVRTLLLGITARLQSPPGKCLHSSQLLLQRRGRIAAAHGIHRHLGSPAKQRDCLNTVVTKPRARYLEPPKYQLIAAKAGLHQASAAGARYGMRSPLAPASHARAASGAPPRCGHAPPRTTTAAASAPAPQSRDRLVDHPSAKIPVRSAHQA